MRPRPGGLDRARRTGPAAPPARPGPPSRAAIWHGAAAAPHPRCRTTGAARVSRAVGGATRQSRPDRAAGSAGGAGGATGPFGSTGFPSGDLPPLPPPPPSPDDEEFDPDDEDMSVSAPNELTGMALVQRELGGQVIAEYDE